MKLKSGTLVEVLRRGNGPCSSWFPAKIIDSSYGSSYIVRYESFMDCRGEFVVESVCGEDVRPHPPHEKRKRWMVGDIVEAFDTDCWRVGKVAKMMRNSCYVVKLFGSIQLREFDKSDLRVRQAWHNNKWSILEKRGWTRKSVNGSSQSRSLIVQGPREPICREACHGHDHGKFGFTPRTTNRGHAYCPKQSAKDLVRGLNHKKRRLIPSPSDEQVDFFTVPRRFRRVQSSEDSNQCSVASCSINEYNDYPASCSDKLLENESDSSDAESSYPSLSGKQHLPPSPAKNLEVDVHELELRAYNSTLQALFASGPLSWEQETLLTNLRFSLNISNEEHLLQLRNLLSAAVL